IAYNLVDINYAARVTHGLKPRVLGGDIVGSHSNEIDSIIAVLVGDGGIFVLSRDLGSSNLGAYQRLPTGIGNGADQRCYGRDLRGGLNRKKQTGAERNEPDRLMDPHSSPKNLEIGASTRMPTPGCFADAIKCPAGKT